MKTYRITIEVCLKDTADLYYGHDFIEQSIEEQLEPGEFMNEYKREEITE
jgi:hypothetical protein